MGETLQAEERRRALSLSRWLTLIAALAITAIMVSMIVPLFLSHEDATRTAARASDNVLMFVTSEVENSLDAFEGTLRDLRDALQAPDAAALSPEAHRRLLTTKADRTKYIGAIAVVDADGILRESSRGVLPSPINVADRDYFSEQRDHPPAGLFISRPFTSRMGDGELSVAVSLRLTEPDGSFNGVVLGIMKLAYLRDLMAATQLGPNGQVSLLRTDGVILMRNRGTAQAVDVGASRASNPVFQQALREGAGRFDAASPTDDQVRRYTFRTISGMQLMAGVSQNVRDIYEEWNRRAVNTVLITVLACISIIVLAMLFHRELLRRSAAEAALSRLATVDGLTGIANRRRFDEWLEREWRRASRTGGTLALLMIDVDRFKPFNDKHGHWMGDAMLVQIAREISTALTRPGDFVARYGGEEFAVVLPDTDLDGACHIAERIRAAVEATTIADPSGALLSATVSIGACAVEPAADMAVGEFIRIADSALYAAKNGSRNMVATASAPPRPPPAMAVAS